MADLFEVSFTGGAGGTQLTQLTQSDDDDTFFHTAPGGAGVYGSFPLTIVSHDGFQSRRSSVSQRRHALVHIDVR